MSPTIGASRVATLVDGFDRSPAYAGLADALTLLIGDGRIGVGLRLPSERELTEALGVSRTTVTRAYAALREAGYAEARQGAGTFTRVPGGRSRAHDRALLPRAGDGDAIDLNCAAPSAPPGIAHAYAEAAGDLPAYLGGHGYFPAGLPELQAAVAATYDARGLPTSPEQIMITPGALTAGAIVAQAFTSPGDRVLVESPTYPNATDALRHAGARLVPSPVDPDGWDLDAVAATLRQSAPRLAYLIPDFQNPTGHLMTAGQREEYAAALRRTRTVAIVDEAHASLALEGQEMPRPFACFAPDTITVGSASKSFWGGLRLGWIRAPREQMERLTQARVSLDLGAPVLEQLVLARLLADASAILAANRERLREQRDALATAVAASLPDWGFHLPTGGLALWCRLPGTHGTALAAEAERRGVIIAPGPVFAAEGGLDTFVRIPWTRPVDELTEAVRRIADAWAVVRERPTSTGRPNRVMVA
ncbi:MocR-like transcription factor YczR [Nocardioides mangrovi]|uniref:PLP-dependent aminotransferase family protein n=1 Tax=Nocardioides mangrovi TaxID=2874580 RepID=A0ABS7U840_9ACTN|nr:PLP-dependent aminotransferase family protein [Nocardioides mangrovi]MBZ5737148.1 PLP-dependent aminotransferase family protein [Nocardioides mangrovi]